LGVVERMHEKIFSNSRGLEKNLLEGRRTIWLRGRKGQKKRCITLRIGGGEHNVFGTKDG